MLHSHSSLPLHCACVHNLYNLVVATSLETDIVEWSASKERQDSHYIVTVNASVLTGCYLNFLTMDSYRKSTCL